MTAFSSSVLAIDALQGFALEVPSHHISLTLARSAFTLHAEQFAVTSSRPLFEGHHGVTSLGNLKLPPTNLPKLASA